MITETTMVQAIYEAEPYLYFMEKIYTQERAQIEANFLAQLFNIQPHHKILDLPCGYGRHSNLLASKGCQVTGIDSNPTFLQEAAKRAENQGLNIDYQLGDMRKINYANEFDFVFNLGTSFGIFSKEENRMVLDNISKALKRGGKFCLEHFSPNHVEMVKNGMKRSSVFEFGDNFLLDRIVYHESTNQLEYKRVYLWNGMKKEANIFIQIYSAEQMSVIFQSMGLKLIDIYGSAKGNLYTKDSSYMLLVAEKEF